MPNFQLHNSQRHNSQSRRSREAAEAEPGVGSLHPHPVIVIALVLFVSAASAWLEAAGQKKKPVAANTAPLVWPVPPEPPRIRFITTYQGVDDFKGKRESRWKTLLLGPNQGPSGDRLVKPYGVAAAADGRVFVTDTVARRVFVFDPQARTVSFVGESGAGKIAKPVGVAVDSAGTVFVADATLNRVFGYAPDGRLVVAIGREGELENPSGLAIDRDRHLLYVADAKKHQILCYSSADGSLVRTIGKRGIEKGEFNFPTNLFVDRQGRLYVADTLNFRVQVFDSSGTPLKAIGEQGNGPGRLNRAKGVGVDSEGHIYVADSSFNNFQIFDENGAILLFVGTSGFGPGEFLLPAGLFVDERDRIYVADQGNARVQVFEYLKGTTDSQR
jgi:DNA-binding beta-propeller fold protein YncE